MEVICPGLFEMYCGETVVDESANPNLQVEMVKEDAIFEDVLEDARVALGVERGFFGGVRSGKGDLSRFSNKKYRRMGEMLNSRLI